MNQHFRLYKFGDKVGVAIDRNEAERAIYAMASGRAFLSKNGALAGSGILEVVPDFHRALGYKEAYRGEIKLDTGSKEYIAIQNDFGELAKKVKNLTETGKEHLIGTTPAPKLIEK
jgi:hypothetical protein